MTFDDKKLGLYDKWYVARINDTNFKHTECEKFVLDLQHDKFAVIALQAYAEACREEYPQLAQDIIDRINHVVETIE